MEPDKNANKQFLKQIPDLLPKFCDRCGSLHTDTDLEQVSSEGTKATYKLSCKNCGNTYLFHVTSPMNGILSAKRMPFKPTITTNELKKFSESEEIHEDEVLDIYSSMKEVGTIDDFNKLFKLKKGK